MPTRELPKPTAAELAILRVLWDRGPCTVREVTASLLGERGTGYTTALKFLQIMTEKGLVRRDESARTHIYEAAIRAEQTQRLFVRELIDKVFAGSAPQLVLQALSAKKASRAELAEIRKLLDDLERNAK